MTEPENSSPKDRVEEISVTEVSDQVLQELSGLFGSRESEVHGISRSRRSERHHNY